MLQQILEGDADGSFVLCAEVGVLAEFGVIGCYRFVRGFDVKHLFSSRIWLCYENYNVSWRKLQARLFEADFLHLVNPVNPAPVNPAARITTDCLILDILNIL